MLRALVLFLGLIVPVMPAFAANADQPNKNVNPANDKGGNTGDGKVDDLNRAQLDENQKPAPNGAKVAPAAPGK